MVKFLQQENSRKLSSSYDKNVIKPIVITVNNSLSIKPALELKVLNKTIQKNYQMPKIDNLIQKVYQKKECTRVKGNGIF